MAELARQFGESRFIELLHEAEQLVHLWNEGLIPAVGLEDRLVVLGFYDIHFTGRYSQLTAKLHSAVIPLGRW